MKHGGYQKCAECGHIRDRHDRVVRDEDGVRRHAGCEVGWKPAGWNTSAGGHCTCDAFVESKPPKEG